MRKTMIQYCPSLNSTDTYLKSEKSLRFHSFCTIGSI